MTSLFATMFVPPAPPAYPHTPKPLIPIPTLEQSTSSVHLGGLDGGPMLLTTTTSPEQVRSSWSLSSFFAASALQSLWGGKAGTGSPARTSPYPHSSMGSRPRSSVESLRSSLDQSCRASHTQHSHEHEQRETFRRTNVDEYGIDRNARSKTNFKPQKTSKGTSSWQLRQFAEATLGSGSLKKAVKLPEGEDLNEWLAVNGMSHLWGTRIVRALTHEQWWTSTTRSISSMAPSQRSARQQHVRR